MPPKLVLILVGLTGAVSITRAAEPAANAQLNKDTSARIAKLIDQIADLGVPGMDYSDWVVGGSFLPFDNGWRGDTMPLGQAPRKQSEALRELVKLGPLAVPALVEHLVDRRLTKFPALSGTGGLVDRLWFIDDCDFNSRTQKPPKVSKESQDNKKGFGLDDVHRLTVGDLAYVAIGQIVNREFNATELRGGKLATRVVHSPTRSEALRARVKEHWVGLTREQHKASLLDDFNRSDKVSRRVGAAMRLAYYYPEALEEPALKVLAEPTFDGHDVQRFVWQELYQAKDAAERKKSLDGYIAGKDPVYRDGVLDRLFADLLSAEEDEWRRKVRLPKEPADRTRLCLIELFGLPKTVTSKNAPPGLALREASVKPRLIGGGLVHDRSQKLDRAVRDLLASTKDDYFAFVCIKRLAGRGYDADIENHLRKRPTKPDDWDADWMRARIWWTPVHAAAGRGSVEELAELLHKGANPGTAAKNGDTPLHIAAGLYDPRPLQLLLDAKAPVNPKNAAGETPARLAAAGEHWEAARLLVARGAPAPDVSVAAVVGNTELVKQFVRDDPECVRGVTRSGWTPLHLAAAFGHANTTAALLATKAEIDPTDSEGFTPLHYACRNGHEAVTRVLIKHKASINRGHWGKTEGLRTLHLAAEGGHPRVVELLLDNGAELAALDHWGWTPLHRAAQAGHDEVVQMLQKRGADVNVQARAALVVTPLDLAAETGQMKAAAALLKAKARVNPDEEGVPSPLHIAVKYGQRDMVALLLRYGADPTADVKELGTPLQMVEARGDKDLVRLLAGFVLLRYFLHPLEATGANELLRMFREVGKKE